VGPVVALPGALALEVGGCQASPQQRNRDW
jgi:hypothetical protein